MRLKQFLKENMKKTIAVDFDGVIHSYERGWDDGSIYGTPITGAKEFLNLLKKEFEIVIFTSRIIDDEDGKKEKELRNWLTKYEIPFDDIKEKMIAIAYVDDRAVKVNRTERKFSWSNAYEDIKTLSKVKS